MLVVSDATPLNILIRSELVDVLPKLFESAVIPPAVRAELTHSSTPDVVRNWIAVAPSWLSVKTPHTTIEGRPKGLGEREAISLARELHAELLLADDKAARSVAASLGVPTTGTLGVLLQAAERKLIDFRQGIARVRAEGLFLTDELVEQAIVKFEQRPQERS